MTGAKFLVEADHCRLLLECGLFQGLAELKARNWARPPLAPDRLDAIVISHAHIDHCGYLPRLVREGYGGPVYCSPGTAALLRIMLPDAAKLQEEEAEFRNRRRATRHQPALPLFTSEDAGRALALIVPRPFGTPFTAAAGAEARLHRSGHILGASIVEIRLGGHRLVYSGDLGRYDVPVLKDPEVIREATTLLVESTYGNREHARDDGTPVLVEAVQRAVTRGGWLLIPAFAVGRTQDILYILRELEEAGRIPRLPVHLDSPMGIAATAIYAAHPDEHDAAAVAVATSGHAPFVPARFEVSRTSDDSKRLNDLDGPRIVIAGSGMATGGRVLHHLRRLLPDARTTVLFAGYQAAGTRGRALREGAEHVRIFGEEVAVRASILATDALSAHADQMELLRWLRGFVRPPVWTYTVHGEPIAAAALRDAIVKDLGWSCAVAEDGQQVQL